MTVLWKGFNLLNLNPVKLLKQSTQVKQLLLIFPILVSINQVAFSATHTASAIQGSFGVSGGSANYSIPITIPPGMAGMEPSVSLSYSSQGGNGVVGLGWSIGGLSLISRCAQKLAQDGIIRGVDFTSEDKFCLDGVRLVNISSLAYGADGSEYRTETDSFYKIKLYDADGLNGPDYFEVFTKSGQKKIYGNYGGRLDAQIEAEGRTQVHLWPMSRVEDTVGNYADFLYFNDKANGFTRIDRINYTGNDVGGLTPSATIKFIFETRPDKRVGFMNGSKMNVLERLINIQTYVGNINSTQNLVKDYNLVYQISLSTNQSQLTSITECDNQVTSLCKKPVSFDWVKPASSSFEYWTTSFTTSRSSNSTDHYFADINGDGQADWIQINKTTDDAWVQLAAGGGTFDTEISYPNTDAANSFSHFFVDVDGDGKSDWIRVNKDVDEGDIALATDNGNFAPRIKSTVLGATTNYAHYFVDTNGDGLADWIQVNKATNGGKIALSIGGDTFDFWTVDSPHPGATSVYSHYFVDVNGDGMTDWVQVKKTSNEGWIGIADGLGSFTFWSSYSNGPGATDLYTNYFSDVNGDGLADWIQVKKSSNEGWIGISDGAGSFTFWSSYSRGPGATDLYTNYFSDVNGDGLSDWIQVKNDSNEGWIGIADAAGSFTFWSSYSNGPGATNLYSSYFADVDGDGDSDWVQVSRGSNASWLGLVDTDVNQNISTIRNGLGNEINISYKPLTDNSVYTKYNDADTALGIQDVQAPIYVVDSYNQSNGIGGTSSYSYQYEGLKAHRLGRGSLGYRKITMFDNSTGFSNERVMLQGLPNIDTDFPLVNQLEYDITRIGTRKISETYNTWNVIPRYTNTVQLIQMTESLSNSYELNTGLLVKQVKSTTVYENDNDPSSVTVDTLDGYKTITTNTYQQKLIANFNVNFSRLAGSTVQRFTPTAIGQIKESSFDYDVNTGLLIQEIIEPNNPDYMLVTDTSYDVFGNKETITTSGHATAKYPITPRTTTSSYLQITIGTFAPQIETINDLGHREVKTYDSKFGVVTKLVGPNGLATNWTYDTFGRKIKEIRADGSYTTLTYTLCEVDCLYGALLSKTTQDYGNNDAINGPSATTYYDMLGREIISTTTSFNGDAICKDTQYDSNGRVQRTSLPYFAANESLCAIYSVNNKYQSMSYDELGRVIDTTHPSGRVDRATYNGFISTHNKDVFGLNQITTKYKNSQDKVIRVTDNAGGNIFYEYDPSDNLTKVTDDQANVTSISYNLRNFKTAMNDPDMGIWSYEYNALGELMQQTNAKGQVTSMSYDTLGRMITRVEPVVGGGSTTSNWLYDGANGIGKPSSVSNTAGYSSSTSYDIYSRPTQNTTSYNGNTDTVTTVYDSVFGRVDFVIYPSLLNTNGFTVKNIYNVSGFLTSIRDANAAANDPAFWTLNSVNSSGQTTSETYGNNVTHLRSYYDNTGLIKDLTSGIGTSASIQNLHYQFDALANLTQRNDQNLGVTEISGYNDGMNRLTGISVSSATVNYNKTYTYDSIGNIVTKSDVGSYVYGENAKGPHQVTTAGGVSYDYDANGNMISGNGRTLSYTAFNKPNSISKGSTTSVYEYDAAYNRIQKTTSVSGVDTTTYYLGKALERIRVSNSSVVEQKFYVAAGYATLLITEQSNVTTAKQRYMHKDHLGSIDAITDELGVLDEQNSFDAWGQRRLDTWAVPSLVDQVTSQTTRGFTGHEMEDDIGLINMNARMYDAVLGRFLQADTFIQFPESTQGYNRYTYVNNNPLSFTDPTGNSLHGFVNAFFSGLGELAGFFIEAHVSVFNLHSKFFRENPWAQQLGSMAAGTLGPGAYAAFQAYMTYVNGGTLADVVRVAAISYITQSALGEIEKETNDFARIMGHGTVGGLTAALYGGDFEKGFTLAVNAQILKTGLDYAVRKGMADKDQGYNSSLDTAKDGPTYKPDPEKMSDPEYARIAKLRCGVSLSVCSTSAANTGSAVYAEFKEDIGKLIPSKGFSINRLETGSFKVLAQNAPGVQAFSILHDVHMGFLEQAMNGNGFYQAINVATIPVYAIVQYKALGLDTISYQQELIRKRDF